MDNERLAVVETEIRELREDVKKILTRMENGWLTDKVQSIVKAEFNKRDAEKLREGKKTVIQTVIRVGTTAIVGAAIGALGMGMMG